MIIFYQLIIILAIQQISAIRAQRNIPMGAASRAI